jgi:hypothetical protein
MSKCDVSIALSHQGSRRTGDEVEGVVVITVDKDVVAKAVFVKLLWRTHGRGNPHRVEVASVALPGGAWSAGQTLQLPFRLRVPAEGPVTSTGDIVSVDWTIRAEVDLPWAIDPKDEVDIDVVAGPEAVAFGTPLHVTSGAMAAGCLALFLVPFFFVGITSTVGGIINGSVFGTLFGMAFLAVPSIMAYTVLRPMVARALVGKADITLSPERCRGGQSVRFSLTLPERIVPRINGVQARLIGEEVAVSGSGTNKTTHRHTFFEEPIAMPTSAGARLSGSVRLPDAARATLYAPSNSVTWSVRIDADIRGLPDPSWLKAMVVDPTVTDVVPVLVPTPPPVPATSSTTNSDASEARQTPGPEHIGRCPRCSGSVLGPTRGHAEQDCTSCEGTFVGADGVAHHVLEPLGFGPADLRELLQVAAYKSPLCCSGCGAQLSRVQLKGIEVDVCSACGGCWLDAGERARLVARR